MEKTKKIGITADCSSNLEYAPFKHNIKITRTCIYFDKEQFVDGIDITADDFYKKLLTTDIIPTTSAPTLQEVVKAVEECKKEGCDTVIHFPISFGLSTYGQNLKQRIDDLDLGVDFHVINPNTACLMQGYQAHLAEIMASKNYSIEEIEQECHKLDLQTKIYFVVDDLKYLVKNGRLSSFKGYLGSFMKIKPIITFSEDGKLVTREQVRTQRKAIERCIEHLIEETKDKKDFVVLVAHTGNYENAVLIRDHLKKIVPNAKRYEIFVIPPTVGAHVGNGILGVGYMGLEGIKVDL